MVGGLALFRWLTKFGTRYHRGGGDFNRWLSNEYEPKLNFKDVLLRPRRSTLKSRADLDLVYISKFEKKYVGIPVIASNMDTVGTFEVAEGIGNYHSQFKFYDEDQK
uniref:IMP dehydrogenase/GMP reductase domain-containing protein n=1 Tax=Wuchereria bancrofti TaxID=6293 RepID=A0AAF5Q7P7_WUCBA